MLMLRTSILSLRVCGWSKTRYFSQGPSLFRSAATPQLSHSSSLKTAESVFELCRGVQNAWPKSLPEEAWYLTVLSSLIACNKIPDFRAVTTHLLQTSSRSSLDATIIAAAEATEAQLRVSSRIKDLLMKEWTLIGIPLTITAATALAAAESAAGMTVSSREKQQSNSHYESLGIGTDTEARGFDSLRTLYRSNLEPIMATWGAHQVDFEWLEKRVIYGLFLSDYDVLSKLETQCVILSAIMCQGLDVPSMWHIRGLRRLGVGVEDAELVCESIKKVASWCGKDTASWIRAESVSIDEE